MIRDLTADPVRDSLMQKGCDAAECHVAVSGADLSSDSAFAESFISFKYLTDKA